MANTPRKNSATSICLMIGAHDADIARWFNMLREEGQSLSRWGGALLLAYDRKEKLDTGNVTTSDEIDDVAPDVFPIPTQEELFQTLGTTSNAKKRRNPRRADGSYVIGSNVMLKLSNSQTVTAYRKIQEEGLVATRILKAMIRAGFSGGDEKVIPDYKSLDQYFFRSQKRSGMQDLEYAELIRKRLTEGSSSQVATSPIPTEESMTFPVQPPPIQAQSQTQIPVTTPVVSPQTTAKKKAGGKKKNPLTSYI